MRKTIQYVVVGLTLFFTFLPSYAGEKMSFKCSFGEGTVADWDTGRLSTKRGNFGGAKNTIHFDSLDLTSGKGRMIAGVGSSDVTVIDGAGLTIIESTQIGNFSFVTIFNHTEKGTKTYPAVISRHMDTPAGPFPSQYYGSCVKW